MRSVSVVFLAGSATQALINMSSRALFVMICTLCSGGALAESGQWRSSISQGVEEALVRNSSGGQFHIDCPSGADDTAPGFFIESEKVNPKAKEKIDLSIVVDGKAHAFEIDEIEFRARSAKDIRALEALVDALSVSRSKTFFVSWPKIDIKETFTLKNARKALKESGGIILEECRNPKFKADAKPPEPARPAPTTNEKDGPTPFQLTDEMTSKVKAVVAEGLPNGRTARFGDRLSAAMTSGGLYVCGTVTTAHRGKIDKEKRFYVFGNRAGSAFVFVKAGGSPGEDRDVAFLCSQRGM